MRKFVKRWIALPLGLGAAAVAAWVLLSASSELPVAQASRGHDEIDPHSREQLRQILRQADEAAQ